MKEKLRYLGLDVHAETIAVAVAEPEGEVRSLGTIPNRAESIRKLIKKLGPAAKLKACYEAGPTGYVVYWQLAELGVECEVVAPTLVPVKAGDRVKTDRRDAEKLARCYRSGDLTAVWVPDEGSEALRDLVRAREAAKQDQTRARHLEQVSSALRSASTDRSQAVDTTLSDLGGAATFHSDRSGVHTPGLFARGRAHAGAGRTPGASHPGSGEAGIPRASTGHQRSTGATRYRRYLGRDHCERVGPGIPLRERSATDGLLRRCTERGFQW